MILDLVQIYHARKDRVLASKLAVQLAQGQLLDRVTAPLLLIHILLWVCVGVATLLIIVSLVGAVKWGGLMLILFPLPLLIAFLAAIISIRLSKAMTFIRELAAGYSDRGIDRVVAAQVDRRMSAKPLEPDRSDPQV